ncbi:MAG: hypothetical protein IKA44_06015 [Clostridia bacterium]|nr:hypothetical protein [Clostridia bacterium]
MNKRNRLNLDILSRINEKIVDEVTLMRIERMNRKKSNRKKILAFGSLAASVALVFGVIFVVLLLMKQVPVYTGMTVSSANPVTAEQVAANPEDYVAIRLSGRSMRVTPVTALGNGKGNNGNGKGNQPAQTTDASMQASGGETIYYAKAGEDIYITVHIDNPDDYIILQFTLNGKVYNSYMFEDGSDMENLILKYNVGDLLGLTEFTLDNIKYLDDGDYKDVRLEGDTTVLVGVYTDQRPTASVTEAKVNFTSISATFSVKDVGNLIALTSGKARAVLYGQDGQRLDEKEVELTEETKVTFEDLIPAETYRLAVESEYDALDGNGRKTYTLYEQEIATKTALRVSAKNVGQTGASFEAVWDEAIDDRKIAKVELYRDGTLQTNVSVGLEGLEGLLSDCDYTLRVDYEYKGKTYTLNVPFHTAAKTEPTYVIENPTKTQTSIGFDLTETDPDNIGTATKIELLHKGVIVKTENADVRSFTDLLSNNEYTVRVTYTYDLNDGTGAQTKTAELAVRTEAKTEPTYVIENPTKTQTSIGFDLTETDPDNIGTATKIELLHKSVIVKTENADVRSFTDLLSNNEYTVRVTYTYDLNDGTGAQTKTAELAVRTEAKTEPTYVLSNPTKTQTSVGFDLTETDPDNIGTATKIELLHKGVIEKEVGADIRSFAELLSNNEYTVRVTYTYDLNDGTGAQTKTAELAVRTEAKTEPTYVIENPTKTQTSVGFDLTETDPDNIGTATKIELWKDGQIVKTAATVDVRSFTELTSYSQYTLKITYTYDLNDGTGVHEKTVEQIFNTPAKEITVTDIRIEGNATIHLGESVTLRVTVNNPDSVSISSFVINGKTVSATVFGASSYLVEYTPALGGRESLSCSAALYALYNETYSQSISYADTDSILILGDVSIAKVELQAGKNVFEEGDEIVAVVTFIGSEGYEMKSIGLSGSYSSSPTRSLTKLTDTTYSFVLPNNTSSMELYEYQIVSVTYGIGSSTDTEEITSERLAYAVIPQQNSVIDISTPQQLQNLKMGKAYRLVKDIDMTGFDWQPYVFSGYLDGNGYKIKNLTINNLGNTAQPDRGKELWSAGLFSHFGGIMKDVVLENASIEIFASKDQGAPYAGFLFGFTGLSMADEYDQEEDALILNCFVQGNITVYSQNTSIGYVGGLMGNCYDSSVYMLNCEYIGTITVTDQSNDEYTIEQLRSCTDPIYMSNGTMAYCTAYCDVTVNGVTVFGEEYSSEYYNQCKYYGYSQRPNQ